MLQTFNVIIVGLRNKISQPHYHKECIEGSLAHMFTYVSMLIFDIIIINAIFSLFIVLIYITIY